MRWVEALVAGLLLVLIRFEYQRSSGPVSFQREDLDHQEVKRCFPALFSFGSSVADTGTYGAVLGDSKTLNPPYGCTFFGKGSGRSCDGRALIDFWATALNIPFLDPYLKSIGSNFRRGANFAASGSLATKPLQNAPFDLKLQVNQFRGFKRQVVNIVKSQCQGSPPVPRQSECQRLPREDDFRDALYVIAMGGNDLFDFYFNYPMEDIPPLVPQVSQKIIEAVEVLYSEGARNILVEDVYPQGCIPIIFQRLVISSTNLDDAGCYTPVNSIVQLHNFFLKKGVTELGERLVDASIAVVETFTPRYDIIYNFDQYGFAHRIEAYLSSVAISAPAGKLKKEVEWSLSQPSVDTFSKCVNISSYIMWDTIHFTDAFNLLTMRRILSGIHFYPKFQVLRNNCTLVEF